MKNIITCYCLILTFSIMSCKSKDHPKGSMTMHFRDTTLNFNVVVFQDMLDDDSKADISFHNFSSSGIVKERITLGGIPQQKGKFSAFESRQKTPSISWASLEDYDLLGGILIPDSSAADSNWIEITEANRRFTKIKGKFQAVMKVKSEYRYGPVGTRIFVTGEFDIRR